MGGARSSVILRRVAIVCGVLSAVVGLASAQSSGGAGSTVRDRVYSAEQAKRGRATYDRKCASCHDGGTMGPELWGEAFLANWDGLTVGDLSERVRVSMPPNNLGRLSRQQIADALSYLLSVNSFPPGKSELEPRTELMKQIRIEATKPKPASGS